MCLISARWTGKKFLPTPPLPWPNLLFLFWSLGIPFIFGNHLCIHSSFPSIASQLCSLVISSPLSIYFFLILRNWTFLKNQLTHPQLCYKIFLSFHLDNLHFCWTMAYSFVFCSTHILFSIVSLSVSLYFSPPLYFVFVWALTLTLISILLLLFLLCHPVMSNSFVSPWTIASQPPLTMGFSSLDYWTGLPFLSPGDLPDPGIEPMSPSLAGGFFTAEPSEKSPNKHCLSIYYKYLDQMWFFWNFPMYPMFFWLHFALRKEAEHPYGNLNDLFFFYDGNLIAKVVHFLASNSLLWDSTDFKHHVYFFCSKENFLVPFNTSSYCFPFLSTNLLKLPTTAVFNCYTSSVLHSVIRLNPH